MKICLIIPPSPFLLDERVFASLGILKVAAALKRAGVRVELLDLSGVANYREIAASHGLRTDAEIFGITATTPQMPSACEIASTIRAARPEARLIIGGPHPTLTHAAVRVGSTRAAAAMADMEELFDVIVAGDGELAIFDAIGASPPKLIDADDPKAEKRLFMRDQDYEASAWPAREMLDLASYHYKIDGAPATSLIAQLGCPFACGFCGGRASPMLRHIRMRSTANIVAEIEHLHRTYGFTGFMFYDDELNVNRNMVGLMNAIADLQERIGVDFKLRGFLKSQLLNDEQAAALKRAGFSWVLVGFESGADRILTNINKKATKDQNTRCIEIADRHGLKTKALMSIGHPGESPETIAETRDWLLSVRPEDFDVTIITTYPGSPYYDEARPSARYLGAWEYEVNGDRLYGIEVDYMAVADYYKGDPDGGYTAYVFTDHLSPDDLVSSRDRLERELRDALCIPFNPSAAARKYEHSMGQLPPEVLRASD